MTTESNDFMQIISIRFSMTFEIVEQDKLKKVSIGWKKLSKLSFTILPV